MSIEDAEVVFGKKRWVWSNEEQREFVSVMTIDQASTTGCLAMLLKHRDIAPAEIRNWLENVVAQKLSLHVG